MQKILIIGASSAIAQAAAKIWAQQGAQLFLIGRDVQKLAIIATDLQIRGASNVGYTTANLTDLSQHQILIKQAIAALGKIDIALLAHGTLPHQKICQTNISALQDAFSTNLISSASLLTLLAQQFEQQQAGCLAAITSVAADRGRKNSYVYCAAKAGLSVFLEGLSYRLAASHVSVLDIKPGPVATPMTAHLNENFLWTNADHVAKKIISAIHRKKRCIYVPGYWRWIMLLIKAIPAYLYEKLAAHNDML